MNFESDFTGPLTPWAYKGRAKRFFMYGQEDNQTAHCPNTGSLKGVLENACTLWVRDHGETTTRSLRYTAEVMELKDGTRVGLNTQRTNKLAVEALTESALIPELKGLTNLKLEAKYSAETRFDLSFTHNGALWWGEVKQTTLAEPSATGGTAMFPDAVTERGLKHLKTLTHIVTDTPDKALQLYISTRTDVQDFRPADAIHPAYGQALRQAVKAGVLAVALACTVSPQGISVDKRLPIVL